MPTISERATAKLGPLPVWAWGVVGGGGLFAFRYFRASRATPPETDSAVTTDAVDPGLAPPSIYGSGAAGGYGSGLVDVSSLWTDAQSPFNPDNPQGIAEQIRQQTEQNRQFLDTVGSGLISPPNAGQPPTQVGPDPVGTTPPPPAPSATPTYLKTLGPWDAKPARVPAGYRIVQSGKGKWLAVDSRYHG